MSKALSGGQKLFKLLLIAIKSQNWQKISSWALCLGAIVFMWYWNWRLFLATTVGIGAMCGSYLIQNSHWQQYCQKWQRFLTGSNRQLIFAVGSGSICAFSTYLGASIWANSENRWLATGSIVQSMGSLTSLLLLVWYLTQRTERLKTNKFEKLLDNLSDRQPLKRLIAIRQLTRLVKKNYLSSEYYWQCVECYSLMLSEPQASEVHKALLDSLEELDIRSPETLKRNPIKIPIQLQRSAEQVLDNLL